MVSSESAIITAIMIPFLVAFGLMFQAQGRSGLPCSAGIIPYPIDKTPASKPEEPRVVVERLQTMPQAISVLVQVTPRVNEALEQACVASKLTKAKLVEVALEEYLTTKEYLPGKQ